MKNKKTIEIHNQLKQCIGCEISFVLKSVELFLFNKVWRVKFSLAKIRTAARELLTLDEKDPRRLFEGNALLRRLVRTGVLAEDKMKLDYVLALKTEDFMERRLQTQVMSPTAIATPNTTTPLHLRHHHHASTQVFKLGLAKSIHHARVLIKQRHIRVRKQVVSRRRGPRTDPGDHEAS